MLSPSARLQRTRHQTHKDIQDAVLKGYYEGNGLHRTLGNAMNKAASQSEKFSDMLAGTPHTTDRIVIIHDLSNGSTCQENCEKSPVVAHARDQLTASDSTRFHSTDGEKPRMDHVNE